MIVWPVIQRELRAEARHAFTHWLRVLGAALLLAVFAVMMMDQSGSAAQLGANLFGNLNAALFIAIWILVPSLTADCLSRERREGTLGLLFLTPLTSRGVVVGKSLIHALRAATMLLAALPVLTLPFLIGGVSWRDATMASMLDSSSVLVALAAGLVASSYCKEWNRALMLAEILSFVFLLSFCCALGFPVFFGVLMPAAANARHPLGIHFGAIVELGLGFACKGVRWGWSNQFSGSLPTAVVRAWLWTVVEILLLSALVSTMFVLWAARRLQRTWQEEPLSLRQQWWRQLLFAPRFWKSLFRSRMRRMLERNPVGWLQQRTTIARITKWGWLLFVVIIESFSLTGAGVSSSNTGPLQRWLLWLLAFSLAGAAAGSFRQERQNGALELILVTPLSVGQIILGRLRGLWSQFLPALAMIFGVFVFLLKGGLDYTKNDLDSAFMVISLAGFVSIPVVGLCFSLWRGPFLVAWLLPVGWCLGLPWIIIDWSEWHASDSLWDLVALSAGIALFQVLSVWPTASRLLDILRYRKFAVAS